MTFYQNENFHYVKRLYQLILSVFPIWLLQSSFSLRLHSIMISAWILFSLFLSLNLAPYSNKLFCLSGLFLVQLSLCLSFIERFRRVQGSQVSVPSGPDVLSALQWQLLRLELDLTGCQLKLLPPRSPNGVNSELTPLVLNLPTSHSQEQKQGTTGLKCKSMLQFSRAKRRGWKRCAWHKLQMQERQTQRHRERLRVYAQGHISWKKGVKGKSKDPALKCSSGSKIPWLSVEPEEK